MINPDTTLPHAVWRKSSRSGGGNQCVELAQLGADRAVRDSKNPEGGHLTFSTATFDKFITRIKSGAYSL